MATVPRPPIIYGWRQLSRHAALRTHDTDRFKLPLQQVLPPGRASMELPPKTQARLSPQDWIQSTPTTLRPAAAASGPTVPVDWPVPRSQRRNLADWQDYILPWSQAPPINQNDWPLPPRAARRPVQDWFNTFIPPAPALPLMGQIWME